MSTFKKQKEKKLEVCRICLTKDGNRVSFNSDSEWSSLFDYCLGITVIAECGPQILCAACSDKLVDFSAFKKLALKSDTLWNNVLGTKIKQDPGSIEIKDEDDSCEILNSEYLDMDFNADSEIDKQEFVTDEETPVPVGDFEIEISAKNRSICINKIKSIKETEPKKKHKKDKDKISKEHLKGLSQKQFIRRFFEIFKDKKKVKYECSKCGNEFARVKSLPLHVQKCYDSEVLIMKTPKKSQEPDKNTQPPPIFDCGLCDFQDVNEHVVLEHVNVQHCQLNYLNCKKCDYVGRDLADVISHRYKHMPSEYKYRYKCPHCEHYRLNKLCLQFHYRSQHLKKPGGWCSVCDKTFTGYIYFRNHVRLHKEENYVCDYCGQKFLFRNLIEAHIKEHMNVRNYICDTCGKSFKRNNALTGHIRAYHTDLKPVPCGHCNKQFKNAYSLKTHMKMVKKGNRFVCDICYKGYATMSIMKKHRFWHTGERPFACETCGAKYKSRGNLKLHIKKHMGIYPHKCDSCGKQFMTSTQLRAHSSVHTGIRRVKCLVCDRTFHEKRQMLAHCQSKHESFMIKHEGQGTSVEVAQVLHGTVHNM